MKIKIITLIIAILTNAGVQAQYFFLKGKVISSDKAVEYAYMVNSRTNTAMETNEEGIFKMETNMGDTIKFRCLGFRDTTFVVNEKITSSMLPIFEVKQESYVLNEVEVKWFYSYASFRHAFANLKLDNKDQSFNYNIKINKNEISAASKLNTGSLGISFTPGGKYLTPEQKKEIKIKDFDNRMERYNRLTSYENLQAYTGLSGKSLESFIIYLRSRKNINPDWDEYNIMLCIKAAYETYLAMNDTISTTKDTIQ